VQHSVALIRDRTKETRFAQMSRPDIHVFGGSLVATSIRRKYEFSRPVRRFYNGQFLRKQAAKLSTREQTRVLTESRIVLRKKDCSVGQSIPFSLISAARTSAEDIEQHVNRGPVGIDSPALR
jgi:hypothetical protein